MVGPEILPGWVWPCQEGQSWGLEGWGFNPGRLSLLTSRGWKGLETGFNHAADDSTLGGLGSVRVVGMQDLPWVAERPDRVKEKCSGLHREIRNELMVTIVGLSS